MFLKKIGSVNGVFLNECALEGVKKEVAIGDHVHVISVSVCMLVRVTPPPNNVKSKKCVCISKGIVVVFKLVLLN